MRQLIIDTASEACSVALVDDGHVVDFRHEIIGRGHAERLVPAIAELDGGGRAERISVGCGPGSFAGVRIGIAAARGLALGWGASLEGFSTLGLVAAAAAAPIRAEGGALVVMEGGHGQWFVQPFDADLAPLGAAASLLPAEAIALDAALVVGNRAEDFVAQRGYGHALAALPDARVFASLPASALFGEPQPIYGREPDAKKMGDA